MMTCAEITRSVTDFLDHKLKLRSRIEFLVHIAMCRGCRTYLGQVRQTIGAMALLRVGREPGPPIDEALAQFRKETGRSDT